MQEVSFKTSNGGSGQSTIEFALIFPVFLAVFIGLVYFSILFYSYVTLQLAVRQGASALVHDPTQSIYSIRSDICNSGFAFIRSQMSVKVEPPDTAGTAPTSCDHLNPNEGPYTGFASGISVSVTGFYTVPLPNVSFALSGNTIVILAPIPIQAQSVMTIE
jgi:Flp pilus assembly protein TadG